MEFIPEIHQPAYRGGAAPNRHGAAFMAVLVDPVRQVPARSKPGAGFLGTTEGKGGH